MLRACRPCHDGCSMPARSMRIATHSTRSAGQPPPQRGLGATDFAPAGSLRRSLRVRRSPSGLEHRTAVPEAGNAQTAGSPSSCPVVATQWCDLSAVSFHAWRESQETRITHGPEHDRWRRFRASPDAAGAPKHRALPTLLDNELPWTSRAFPSILCVLQTCQDTRFQATLVSRFHVWHGCTARVECVSCRVQRTENV